MLIPRPETELLVDLAIGFSKNKETLSLIDVGTGSGVIAISLAVALPNANIYAADISMPALKVAKENAESHHQDQIKFIQSNLLAPFRGKFDLICANLPYVPSQALKTLQVSKWEPRMALDGGSSGLDLIEALLLQTTGILAGGGMILLEIEANLGKESLEMVHKIMPGARHQLHQDLAGKDRILQIQLP